MIGVIGLDHRRASLEVRGPLSFAGERLREALGALGALGREAAIEEVVIISTCNRTEVYVSTAEFATAEAQARRYLGEALTQATPVGARSAAASGVEGVASPLPGAPLRAELDRALFTLEGLDAARRLFRVAAGLESMVVGEAQILGQVRDALAEAEAAGAVGDELRALFTAALKVGKRARAETEIGRADSSVAALAIRVARDALDGLSDATALVIGAGKTSQLCARLLREGGVGRLLLANRTPETARALAEKLAGESVPLDDVARLLPQTRLIVSATAAPHPVLTAETVRSARAGSPAPLLILDLATPPDVEDAVAFLPGVTLYTLDTLGTLAEEEPPAHAAEIARIEEMVEQASRDYVRATTIRLAAPGIAALRRHVDRSEQAELARALTHLEHLSAADRATIERFGQRLVDKMFHHLVSRIRSLAEYDEIPPEVTMQVLARLFSDPDERRADPHLS